MLIYKLFISNRIESHMRSVFLSDEPYQKESAFEIHEAISKAIVDEIKEGNPSNISIIAEWGSGKSTILNYIHSQLDDSYIFFSFDAWAHSGDALRKNFIKSFAKAIVQNNSKKEEPIKKYIDNMNGSTSKTETDEHTSFSPLTSSLFIGIGLYALLNVIIAPFNPLIDSYIDQYEATAFGLNTIRALADFGITILFPLIVGICSYLSLKKESMYFILHNVVKKVQTWFKSLCTDQFVRTPKNYKNAPNKSSLLNEITSFIAKKSKGKTTTTTYESLDILDSLKFEELFFGMLGIADKKTIIAFDNLDRLNDLELFSTWTTLQIFCNPDSKIDFPNRPWVILPISRRVFSELESLTASTDQATNSVSLSKLFIRNFEIPTLISTDWKNYFFALAKQAFPDINENTLSSVYAIASHSLLKMEMRTPRNAKRFLNSMVSKSRVYPNVNLISIAAYCFLRDSYEINASNNSIENETSFSSFMLQVVEKQAVEYPFLQHLLSDYDRLSIELSMLAFGQFSEERAFEVRVVSIINDAIAHNSEVDFESLVKDNIGSWELITARIEEELSSLPDLFSPSWTLSLIRSLDPNRYIPNTKHKTGRDRLVQLLMSSIEINNETDIIGYGESIANCLELCTKETIDSVCASTASYLQTLLSNSQDDVDDKPQSSVVSVLHEASFIFQTILKCEESLKVTLSQKLGKIDFGSFYADTILCALQQDPESSGYSWISLKPAFSIAEICSVLRTLHDSIVSNLSDENLIRFIDKNGILESSNAPDEKLEDIRGYLRISENNESWKSFLWIIKNIHGSSALLVNKLFQSIPFEANNYPYDLIERSQFHKLAFIDMTINSGEALDENELLNSTIADAFDVSLLIPK